MGTLIHQFGVGTQHLKVTELLSRSHGALINSLCQVTLKLMHFFNGLLNAKVRKHFGTTQGDVCCEIIKALEGRGGPF